MAVSWSPEWQEKKSRIKISLPTLPNFTPYFYWHKYDSENIENPKYDWFEEHLKDLTGWWMPVLNPVDGISCTRLKRDLNLLNIAMEIWTPKTTLEIKGKGFTLI